MGPRLGISSARLRAVCFRLLLACAAVADPATASAQTAQLRQPTTAFFSGQIADYANGRLTVLTEDGLILKAMVGPRSKIAVLTPAEFTDLQEGTYIASAGYDKGDGGIEAYELRIVDEEQRGIGEGHRPFHGGEDDATTTNAKIVSVSTAVFPPEILVRMRGRDMRIVLPGDAPIMFQTVGTPDALVPGAPVSVFTVRSRSGNTDVVRISVGQDGVIPLF